MKETESLFKTQEKKSKNWCMYPFNSYSSLFYLIILEKLYKKDLNFINIYGIIITISLTISSFLWWARRNKNIHLVDINSYSLLIFYIGIYYLYNLSDKKYIYKNLLIFITILVIFTTLVKKKNVKLFNYIGGVLSFIILTYYSNSLIQYLGIFLLLLSVKQKFFDTYNIIDFNKYKLISGTGWFHIFSALGIYCIL